MVCTPCNPGYVCLGKTSSATPTSAEEDGGYACPAGYYCPHGSSREVPCTAGYYSPLQGSSEASSCVPCPEGLYQVRSGRRLSYFVCAVSPRSMCPFPTNRRNTTVFRDVLKTRSSIRSLSSSENTSLHPYSSRHLGAIHSDRAVMIFLLRGLFPRRRMLSTWF